ncbi:MAG: Type 1 glutamine amidotransferase-like domain-containing protein [Micromonosporaceae bacterium]
MHYALELSGAERPRVASLGTAMGDQVMVNAWMHEAFYTTEARLTCVNLFPMPNFADLRGHLLSQDVIWVGGGSVAGLLALWRLHGFDTILRECWEAGVVLAGVSAGSLCWHAGGTTDSYGPELRAVTDGLGFLPYANGVHYDSENQRRPLLHQLIGDGTLPAGYATDDGAGLVYHGTELVEVVSDRDAAAGYQIVPDPDRGVVETRIEPRRLPDPARV